MVCKARRSTEREALDKEIRYENETIIKHFCEHQAAY